MVATGAAPASDSTPGIRFAGVRFTPMDPDETLAALANRDWTQRFSTFVTPNAEHVYLYHRNPEFAAACEDSFLSTNDSRVLRRAAKFAGLDLKLTTGSGLTPRLFDEVIAPDDPLTVIGSSPELMELLRARFGLTRLVQHVPPMGFIRDDAAVAAAIDFVAAHPARFVFIAMGPPQSEQLCRRIVGDGRSTGIGLCIGSSLSLLTGALDPTPAWMHKAGMLWLHRLLKEPRRLWRRYLVNDMIALGYCLADIIAIRFGGRRVRARS